jgi:nitrogen fixation NifU-like protein
VPEELAGRAPWSDAVLDHLRHPRNAGRLPRHDPGVGTGEAGDADAGELLRVQLRAGADGRVAEARFQAFGCPATIAAGSVATELALGRTPAEIRALAPDAIARPLALPAERVRTAELALQALFAAVAALDARGRAG